MTQKNGLWHQQSTCYYKTKFKLNYWLDISVLALMQGIKREDWFEDEGSLSIKSWPTILTSSLNKGYLNDIRGLLLKMVVNNEIPGLTSLLPSLVPTPTLIQLGVELNFRFSQSTHSLTTIRGLITSILINVVARYLFCW